MAITFVGSATGSSANAVGSIAFSALLDSGGAAPTVAQNDLAVVYAAKTGGSKFDHVVLSTTGYTQASSDVYGNGNDDINLTVWYKFMGASPDTQVAWTASGSANEGQSVIVHLFRGVDQTTPLDVFPADDVGGASGQADVPTITPTTAGAWVIGGGVGVLNAAMNNYAVPSNATNTTNYFRRVQGNGTVRYAELGVALYTGWTSGAYNMNAFAGTANSNSRSAWAAMAVALRPNSILAYSLTAAVGTFTYTGQAAALTPGKSMIGDVGTFTYTGQAATLRAVASMTATVGVFTYSGQSTTPIARSLTAAMGSFVLSGQPASISVIHLFLAASPPGAMAITGQAVPTDLTLTDQAAPPAVTLQ